MVKKLLTGIAGLLAVFMVIGVAACGGGEQSTASESPAAAESSNPQEAAAPAESSKSKNDKGDVHVPLAANSTGEISATKDKAHKVTIVEIADPAQSDNQFEQPTDGNRYWAIRVEAENAGAESIYLGDWKLRGSNDFEYDRQFLSGIGEQLGIAQNLTPGGKTAGWVAFEIPADVQPKWLRYDPNPFLGKDLYFDAQP